MNRLPLLSAAQFGYATSRVSVKTGIGHFQQNFRGTEAMRNQPVLDVDNGSLHAPSLFDAVALVIVVVGGVALRQYGWAGGSTRSWDYPSHAHIMIHWMHMARHVMSAASPVGFG